MITIRRSNERGHFDFGWLDTYHTFSFGDYYDPRHVRFGSLRVINEDRVAAGAGFPMHGHRDMEILTYVIDGALEHRDSLGNRGVIRPGEIQRMSAGTGIQHSEFNPSASDPVHLLQIWIMPDEKGLTPTYEQRPIQSGGRGWTMIASPDGREGSMTIHQNAVVLAGRMRAGESHSHEFAPGAKIWVQVIEGSVRLGGEELAAGDGAGVTDAQTITLSASDEGAHLLVFEMS